MSTTPAWRDQDRNAGKFGHRMHPEIDVDLDEAPNRPDLTLDSEVPKDLMEMVEAAARYRYSKNRTSADDTAYDAEDFIQDTWVAMLETKARHGGLGHIENPKAWINGVTRRTTLANTHPHYDATAAKAKAALGERVAEFTESMGRTPSPRELDQLAERVRMEDFAQDSRPRINFHRERFGHTRSLDATLSAGDEGGTTLGEMMQAGHEYEPESAHEIAELHAANLASGLRDEELAGLKAARSSDGAESMTLQPTSYNQMATLRGAPLAQDGTLTRGFIQRKVQPVLRELGGGTDKAAQRRGVTEAIRRWNERDGEDHPGVEALFKPFGDLDVDGRDEVVDMLTSVNRGRHAAEFWDAALRFSETRASASSPEKQARAWAKSQGIEVPTRGRLGPEVISAWRASTEPVSPEGP